jgi:hypothetical protein
MAEAVTGFSSAMNTSETELHKVAEQGKGAVYLPTRCKDLRGMIRLAYEHFEASNIHLDSGQCCKN